MNTGLVFAPAQEHKEAGHPENPGRTEAVYSLLDDQLVFDQLTTIDPRRASIDQIVLAHHPRLVEQIERISKQGGGRIDADTYCTVSSYELALLAAGSVCSLVDELLTGHVKNGIALIRPPGHHAEFSKAMGFCLFNNIAVAARHAQTKHNIERVLIIDFDVHHGNGTQDIFYTDPSVMFISLHLFHPFFYPGTGADKEIGAGDGQGTNINVPFGAGAGDYWYRRAFEDLVVPIAADFDPELILVSAGFDAHWIDPLAAARLSLTGYFEMTQIILRMAHNLCQDRLLICLEGGYDYDALSYGVLNVVRSLLGSSDPIDPLGPSAEPETNMGSMLADLVQMHLPD